MAAIVPDELPSTLDCVGPSLGRWDCSLEGNSKHKEKHQPMTAIAPKRGVTSTASESGGIDARGRKEKCNGTADDCRRGEKGRPQVNRQNLMIRQDWGIIREYLLFK